MEQHKGKGTSRLHTEEGETIAPPPAVAFPKNKNVLGATQKSKTTNTRNIDSRKNLLYDYGRDKRASALVENRRSEATEKSTTSKSSIDPLLHVFDGVNGREVSGGCEAVDLPDTLPMGAASYTLAMHQQNKHNASVK